MADRKGHTFIHIFGEPVENPPSGCSVKELHGAAKNPSEELIMEPGGGPKCPLVMQQRRLLGLCRDAWPCHHHITPATKQLSWPTVPKGPNLATATTQKQISALAVLKAATESVLPCSERKIMIQKRL